MILLSSRRVDSNGQWKLDFLNFTFPLLRSWFPVSAELNCHRGQRLLAQSRLRLRSCLSEQDQEGHCGRVRVHPQVAGRGGRGRARQSRASTHWVGERGVDRRLEGKVGEGEHRLPGDNAYHQAWYDREGNVFFRQLCTGPHGRAFSHRKSDYRATTFCGVLNDVEAVLFSSECSELLQRWWRSDEHDLLSHQSPVGECGWIQIDALLQIDNQIESWRIKPTHGPRRCGGKSSTRPFSHRLRRTSRSCTSVLLPPCSCYELESSLLCIKLHTAKTVMNN